MSANWHQKKMKQRKWEEKEEKPNLCNLEESSMIEESD